MEAFAVTVVRRTAVAIVSYQVVPGSISVGVMVRPGLKGSKVKLEGGA